MKKVLVLITVIVAIGIILVIIYSYSKRPPPIPANPTPMVQPSATSYPTIGEDEKPGQTGAGEMNFPRELEDTANLSFILRTKLPLSFAQFDLSYNYEQYEFVVSIKPPIEENKRAFETWLNDNGFGGIEKEKFVFK